MPKNARMIYAGLLVCAWVILKSTLSVSAAPGDITTVAGNGQAGFSGDGGSAMGASLQDPRSLFVDSAENIYIADSSNNRVRKVDPSGIISTVAGTGNPGSSGDGGPATNASLWDPRGVFVDSLGTLYIADTENNRIRKVHPSGIISTFAGTGSFTGSLGDGGAATNARVWSPLGVYGDSAGNLYIAEEENNRIRKIAPSGIVSTVAGGDVFGFSGDGGPATNAGLFGPEGIFVDGVGNLYIVAGFNDRIRKVDLSGIITTVAGNGEFFGPLGDGGPATDASLSSPDGVFVDGKGSIYIADTGNNRIRKVDPSGTISTVVEVENPSAVFVDNAGNIYIADRTDHLIRKVEGGAAPAEDGIAKSSDFTGDGKVDFSDFVEFAQNFGKSQADPDFDERFDLDDDGSVDFGDFVAFAQAFGK